MSEAEKSAKFIILLCGFIGFSAVAVTGLLTNINDYPRILFYSSIGCMAGGFFAWIFLRVIYSCMRQITENKLRQSISENIDNDEKDVHTE